MDGDDEYDPNLPSEADDDLIDEDDLEEEEEDDDFADDDGDNEGSLRAKKPRRRAPTLTRKPRGAVAKKVVGRKRPAYEDRNLEEEFDSDADHEGAYVLGAEDEFFEDFSSLRLKPDHANRPLWVCPDGRIFLETFSPIYRQAYDFLIAVSEPVSRPESLHEYALTPHSLYAAVSIGLETSTIESVLDRLSKIPLPTEVRSFIRASTENYGKVKLVLQKNKFFVESPHPEVLQVLLDDPTIAEARVVGTDFTKSRALRDTAVESLAAVEGVNLVADVEKTVKNESEDQPMAIAAAADDEALYDPEREIHSFEIDPSRVEKVKQRCLPDGLNFPMLEEYDFRNDTVNPGLNIELKPHVVHRPYQEKSLSKMFGNGRARSGVIVLPCGAGKSLVGVSAAARIKKSCLVLCTNAVSVDQWRYQFQLWTNLQDHQVARFTADKHEWFNGVSGVAVTTYTMVAYTGRRSEESERVMNGIMNREWGLIILDEVHVVPATMFRRVIGIVKAHCKLGLTATLVREDALITDLNFLIGPKLYEANWLDLTRAGHIANVQCAEVWCPMTTEFMREYLRPGVSATQKQLLYVMNPSKLRACQYLVQYHEARGDKVIVFSDNIYALREYAVRMRRPFIYGATGHQERTRVLHAFKHNPEVNTVFLSKVGDNSLDIPEANVLVQISSHAGSRRQEAQRLGRILRKKKARAGSDAEEFDAFFYTLVSTDTQEVYFTAKRQRFLIDQGYAYKVIPSILEAAGHMNGPGLLLGEKSEQLDVLAAVLAAGETELPLEEGEEEGAAASAARKAPTRRMMGSMAALSGAVGIRYLEYSKKKQAGRGAASKSLGKLAKLRK